MVNPHNSGRFIKTITRCHHLSGSVVNEALSPIAYFAALALPESSMTTRKEERTEDPGEVPRDRGTAWKTLRSRRALSGGRAKVYVATRPHLRMGAIIFHSVLEFAASGKGNPNRPRAPI